MSFLVQGDPHGWPRDGKTMPERCALIVVDMQDDYCSPGGFMDQMAYDTPRLREPLARIQKVLTAARRARLTVIYTRHGRAADRDGSDPSPRSLSDKPSTPPQTAARGEPGWDIVSKLTPLAGDSVIEK